MSELKNITGKNTKGRNISGKIVRGKNATNKNATSKNISGLIVRGTNSTGKNAGISDLDSEVKEQVYYGMGYQRVVIFIRNVYLWHLKLCMTISPFPFYL